MKKLTLILSFCLGMITIAAPAAAAPLDDAERLLKEQHVQQCRMSSRTASNSEKAAAQREYMAISNRLGKVKMAIMSDQEAQVSFTQLTAKIGKLPCTDAASKADAKAAAGGAAELVKALGTHLCAYNSTTDAVQQAMAMIEADKVRKKIKDAVASLKNAGDEAAADALDKQVRDLELNAKSGC